DRQETRCVATSLVVGSVCRDPFGHETGLLFVEGLILGPALEVPFATEPTVAVEAAISFRRHIARGPSVERGVEHQTPGSGGDKAAPGRRDWADHRALCRVAQEGASGL